MSSMEWKPISQSINYFIRLIILSQHGDGLKKQEIIPGRRRGNDFARGISS